MGILRNGAVEPNVEVIQEVAEVLGVKFGTAKKPEKLVTKMRDYFSQRLSKVPKDEWIVCPKCQEVTDDDDRITKCPFCGDEGEEEGNQVAETAETADEETELEAVDGEDFVDDSPDAVEPPAVDVNADEEPEPDPEPEAEKPDPEPDPEPEAEPEAEPDPEPDPEPEAEPEAEPEPKAEKPAKKKKKPAKKTEKPAKPAKKRGAKTEEPEPEAEPEAETGIIPTDEELGEVIPEEKLEEMKVELEKEKEIIKREQTQMMNSGYDLGLALRRVYRGHLWKAEGVKSWRAFCEKIGVSHTLAYNLMKLVSEFDRETFLQIGRRKLQLVARAETEEEREQLLDEAKNGASVRELEGKKKELEEKKAEKGEGKASTPPVDDEGKGGRPKQEDQSITLLAKVGGRAKTYPFRNRMTHTEVEVWEKDSYIEIPISDTVVQYIVLKNDEKGSIVGATIAFRKVEKQDNAS